MERDLAGAKLSIEDFDLLAAACRGDPRFPPTYRDWSSLIAVGTRDALGQGLDVRDMPIHVDDFVAWCGRVQVAACLDSLRAYLILIRRSQHVPGIAKEPQRDQSSGTATGESDNAKAAEAPSRSRRRALQAPRKGYREAAPRLKMVKGAWAGSLQSTADL